MAAKTEELRHLLSQLGLKQLELNRKEVVIHSLVESNERLQRSWMKSAEKTERLQIQNSKMKELL